MLDWGFGLEAFGMFFLYDWNRVFLKKKWFVPLFAAGNLLLAVVGGRMVYACVSSGIKEQSVWLLPGAFFLAVLIYTLYFALPLIIHTARRRIGTRSAAQVCMAGAVIQASGGFLAAFSAWAYPPGIRTG